MVYSIGARWKSAQKLEEISPTGRRTYHTLTIRSQQDLRTSLERFAVQTHPVDDGS